MTTFWITLCARAWRGGRRKQEPQTRFTDKGFDCESLWNILRWLGVEPVLPARGDNEHELGACRWFVERTIGWLHESRRLRVR